MTDRNGFLRLASKLDLSPPFNLPSALSSPAFSALSFSRSIPHRSELFIEFTFTAICRQRRVSTPTIINDKRPSTRNVLRANEHLPAAPADVTTVSFVPCSLASRRCNHEKPTAIGEAAFNEAARRRELLCALLPRIHN